MKMTRITLESLVHSREDGQSMIESIFAMFILCILFWGMLQIFHFCVFRLIHDYSAFCTARSAAVGFWGRDSTGEYDTEDGYILRRAQRVAAIGASGKLMADPDPDDDENYPVSFDDNPYSLFGWERERIPEYLRGERWLDYQYWPYLNEPEIPDSPGDGDETITREVNREFFFEMIYGAPDAPEEDKPDPEDMYIVFGLPQSTTLDASQRPQASIMKYYENYLE